MNGSEFCIVEIGNCQIGERSSFFISVTNTSNIDAETVYWISSFITTEPESKDFEFLAVGTIIKSELNTNQKEYRILSIPTDVSTVEFSLTVESSEFPFELRLKHGYCDLIIVPLTCAYLQKILFIL